MAQSIFDPFASIEAQVQDSFEKGFISRDDGDILIVTSRWLDGNRDRLMRQFPGKVVTVVQDRSLPEGFATYVGDSVLEAEATARQFSPSTPYVTLNPLVGLEDFELSDELFHEVLWTLVTESRALAETNPEIGSLLQESDPKQDDPNDKLEAVLDDIAGKLTDAEFARTFGGQLIGDLPFTGGFMKDGAGHANFKKWRVDSQASTSTISKKNFARFQKKGAKPKHEGEEERLTGSGPVKFPKYSGITMRFVRKGDGDKNEIVDCDVPLLVTAADILGADQMKKTGTRLIWDPAGGTGELEKRPAKK